MTGKQRVEEILQKYSNAVVDEAVEKCVGGGIVVFAERAKAKRLEALDSIEEVVKEVIGQENEYSRDMPVPDPDPFALPSDHQNQLRRYQLGRWEGNNGQ